MKKLKIKPVFKKKPYYCSENSLSTLLNYYGKPKTPDLLNKKGCINFNSIKKCIPKSFKKKSGSISEIKRSINSKNPALVSVIPDTNLKTKEKHTILIYGYTKDNLLIIDNRRKTRINYKKFKKIWKRTGNNSWLKK